MNQPIILVTGGTGFIGEAIVRDLRTSGYGVRVLTRNAERGRKLVENYGAEIVVGDIFQPDEVAQACTGVQAIIHLVGIIHQSFADPFEKVHVEATLSVIKGAQMAGVKRYLHMSALGTNEYGRSQYHRTKWQAEQLVRQSDLHWTIFRPSLVFGPGDGFVSLFSKLLTFPVNFLNVYTFPLFGGGKSLFQPIAIENVAQAFVRSLSHEESVGRTYDLCGEERLSLSEILREIVAATGQKSQTENFPTRTILRHSVWALCLLIPLILIPGLVQLQAGAAPILTALMLWLGLLTLAFRWTSIILFSLPWMFAFLIAVLIQNVWIFGKPLLTVDQLIMLQENNVGDPQPAKKLFGLDLIDFHTGIRRYLGAA